ncbi:MAG TPA: nucleotide sugar dehydrogenase [Anaerolineae bacterium]|nr:nucleotide sugar dehydrogenase [Anaerolineae bacterium]
MRDQLVAVIGLGYVGLPLAIGLAEVGRTVIGLDIDSRKVERLNRGESHIPDVPAAAVERLVQAKRFSATTDAAALRAPDAIFICVPTPFDANRAPDLSFIRSAAQSIQPQLRAGHLIVLESTTYPGTTEEILQPILETSGLRGGIDFDLAFVPERIDPGQTESRGWTIINTPKVVGGLTPQGAQRASALLATMGAPVHVVSSPRAAEMAKLLENTFRSVNIALVNELALLCERMSIDVWEVIGAAATKPYGFMPFRPGPGVGGHCIPVDPLYLSWKAREFDFHTNFIDLAAQVNDDMPYHVIELIVRGLSRQGRALDGAQVLVLGVAFKRDIDDARNSPAERLMELLMARGAQVAYHDPYVPQFRVGGNVFHRRRETFDSVSLTAAALAGAECVVVVTGHTSIDYRQVAAQARLVVDTCNAVPRDAPGRVIRLGAPNQG